MNHGRPVTATLRRVLVVAFFSDRARRAVRGPGHERHLSCEVSFSIRIHCQLLLEFYGWTSISICRAEEVDPIVQSRTDPFGLLLRLERSHVDREAVLHIGLEQSVVGFVDLLNRDDLDIGGDVVFAAKIQHLLSLENTADR